MAVVYRATISFRGGCIYKSVYVVAVQSLVELNMIELHGTGVKMSPVYSLKLGTAASTGILVSNLSGQQIYHNPEDHK